MCHVVDVKLAGVGGDLRVEKDLLKHVAHLFAGVGRVVGLDGVDGLVCLFDHVLGDGAVGLLAVPRAAVRLTKPPDRANQPVHLGVTGRRLGPRAILAIYQVRQRTAIL